MVHVRSAVCGLAAALVAAVPMCGAHPGAAEPQATTSSAVVAPASLPVPANDGRTVGALPSLAPLVKQLRPAVVNIYTTQNARPRRPMMRRGAPSGQGEDQFQDFFGQFFGGEAPQQEMKRQALGSGFLIGNGMVLTNNHVIEGADEIKVKLGDGRTFDATVVGHDKSVDVGLLKLSGDAATTTSSVRLGDSDALEVGDYVMAIGNPFGLNLTVTAGIVSAKERQIGAGPYDDFIQTDASINPGNSGGPLFNLNGEVVGINTAIVAQGQGIGFAVPINIVKDLLPQLRDKGHVVRGWLGVGIQEITPELGRTFALNGQKGALISQVFPSGPAAKAGIQNGDVVTEFNGHSIDSPGALSRSVAALGPGSKGKMTYLRDGHSHTVDVTVSERNDQGTGPSEEGGEGEAAPEDTGAVVGLHVQPLTAEVAHRLNVEVGQGVIVTDVEEGSAADAAGVQANDLLVELQRHPVTSVDSFHKAARDVKTGDTVLFRVKRGGSALYLAAKAPSKK